MSRKNIFELLALNDNLEQKVDRVCALFNEKPLFNLDESEVCTLNEFVNCYCFKKWKNRGHCVDAFDFLATIGYEKIVESSHKNINHFFILMELVLNFWKMADIYIKNQLDSICRYYVIYDDFNHLYNIIIDYLSEYNQSFFYNEETEQVLVIEDKPEVTAVAEIIDEPLTLTVIRYNHHTMRGDLTSKKDTLLKLGSYLEGKRNTIHQISPKLEDSIFFMLNNLNLRHNNCDPSLTKNYKKVVSEMTNETLEEWYDELYQMILLVILEMDNKERMKKIDGLKKAITGGINSWTKFKCNQ